MIHKSGRRATEKKRRRSYTGIRKILLLAATIIVVSAGIILPGRVLAIQGEQEYDQVSAVPEQYLASSSAMARNASTNLKKTERLQLITGQWESERTEAKSFEMEQEDYEAVTLARTGMKELYDSRQYPVDLSSDYSNWYTWAAKSHKAVDTTFHTYTAYYWIIHFEKYDGSEIHTIQMLDDGTIFLAEAVMQEDVDVTTLTAAADALPAEEERTVTPLRGDRLAEVGRLFVYEDVDITDLDLYALAQVEEGEESYYILQMYQGKRYLYSIVPQGSDR